MGRRVKVQEKPPAGTLVIEGSDPEEVVELLAASRAFRAAKRSTAPSRPDPYAVDARLVFMLALEGKTAYMPLLCQPKAWLCAKTKPSPARRSSLRSCPGSANFHLMPLTEEEKLERRRASWREYKARNPNAAHRWKLQHRYGLSEEDFDIMLKRQNGVCAILPEARDSFSQRQALSSFGRSRP